MPKPSRTCVYCHRPQFTAGMTANLCEQHLDLWLIVGHLKRTDIAVNKFSIAGEMRKREDEKGYKFSFAAYEIPGLLAQMTTEDYVPVMTRKGVLVEA